MRIRHIIGGQIVFGIGLFLIYLNSPLVVEVFKGAIQPITIVLGLIAMAAGIFGKADFKNLNLIVSGALLAVGFYGLYDEYYAVMDFIYGFIPLFLIVVGVICMVAGIKKLK